MSPVFSLDYVCNILRAARYHGPVQTWRPLASAVLPLESEPGLWRTRGGGGGAQRDRREGGASSIYLSIIYVFINLPRYPSHWGRREDEGGQPVSRTPFSGHGRASAQIAETSHVY